jgi:phosphopantetheinyl transferase
LREASLADERAALACLSLREGGQLERLHNRQRRREWLAGRALAKQLIVEAQSTDIAVHEIEILPSAESRRPQVWICGRAEPCSLSIAHSSRGVLVALGKRAETLVGVDLSERTPLSASFERLWYTADERQWLKETRLPFASNCLWATKEAIFKACNRGEGFDPRQINAVPDSYRYRGVPIPCHVDACVIDDQFAVVATVAKSNTPLSHQFLQELHS